MGLGEHLAQLMTGLRPPEPLDVSLSAALGSPLAADVVCPRPVPHFPVCQRAGYAVRSADAAAGVALRVVDHVAPGFASSQPVYAGVCVQVLPGAMLPGGADAIIDPRAVRRDGDTVLLTGSVPAGTGVAARGSTVGRGDLLLPAGRVVDVGAVGVLSAAGIARVPVIPPPRVVVVVVGNGLIGAASPATDGLLFDSSGPMIAASALRAGAHAAQVGPVAAEERTVAQVIEDQLVRADLIVVSGGSEAGESGVRDYLTATGTVQYDEGSTSLGPFGHGVIGDDRIPVLALPVHPVRAVMLFEVIAVPLVRAMHGAAPQRPDHVVLAGEAPQREGATMVLLAARRADGRVDLLPEDPTVGDFAAADVIVRILPGSGRLPAGSRVPAVPASRGYTDDR